VVTYTKRLAYVLITSTLGPVQLLVTSDLPDVATLEPVHPSTQPLYHFANTIGARVELTRHHERLWLGHG